MCRMYNCFCHYKKMLTQRKRHPRVEIICEYCVGYPNNIYYIIFLYIYIIMNTRKNKKKIKKLLRTFRKRVRKGRKGTKKSGGVEGKSGVKRNSPQHDPGVTHVKVGKPILSPNIQAVPMGLRLPEGQGPLHDAATPRQRRWWGGRRTRRRH